MKTLSILGNGQRCFWAKGATCSPEDGGWVFPKDTSGVLDNQQSFPQVQGGVHTDREKGDSSVTANVLWRGPAIE